MRHALTNRKRPPSVIPRQIQITMRGAKTRAEAGYSLGGKPKKIKPITLATLPWDKK